MATKKKQFDFNHLVPHPALQEVELAHFSARAMAFGVDWIIVALASRFSWAVVLLVVIYWAFRGKLFQKYRDGKQFLDTNFQHLDNKLAKEEIDESLRKNFLVYLRVYIYILIFLFLLVSFAVAIGILVGAFYVDEFGILNTVSNDEFLFFKPIQNIANIFDFLGSAIGAICYFSFFTWHWKGQTIGKRIFKIRVVRLNGAELNLWNSFERMSGYVSSASLFLSGFFQYFWDRNHQTTHDKICETIVIKEDSWNISNSFRNTPNTSDSINNESNSSHS